MLDLLIDVLCDVVPDLLAGAAIGVLAGVVVMGLNECFNIAWSYFREDSNIEAVEVLKKNSQTLKSVFKSCPRLRAAMSGGKTGMILTYQNGRLATYEAIDKQFNSDFNDCGGYVVYSNDKERAYKIR